jgi:hypothetical protein
LRLPKRSKVAAGLAAGGRQLQGQRQTVQAHAQLSDRAGVVVGEDEVGIDAAGSRGRAINRG